MQYLLLTAADRLSWKKFPGSQVHRKCRNLAQQDIASRMQHLLQRAADKLSWKKFPGLRVDGRFARDTPNEGR
jgi:hypothetical protein